MSLPAGSLCDRVTIQQKITTRDDYGSATTAWMDLATVWAQIVPLSGREFIAAQQAQSTVTARVTIRYRADVDSHMRIVHGGDMFNVEAVLPDMNSGREYLTLMCSMVDPAVDAGSGSIDGGNAASAGIGSIDGGRA